MLDLTALNGTLLLEGLLVVIVFGGLRFLDDVVDVMVSLGGDSPREQLEDADAPNP